MSRCPSQWNARSVSGTRCLVLDTLADSPSCLKRAIQSIALCLTRGHVQVPVPVERIIYKDVLVPVQVHPTRRRWSSNLSGKCSYEQASRVTVCGTMRIVCGTHAGCLAIDCHSLPSPHPRKRTPNRAAPPKPLSKFQFHFVTAKQTPVLERCAEKLAQK